MAEQITNNDTSIDKGFFVQWDVTSITEGNQTFTVIFPASRRAVEEKNAEANLHNQGVSYA